MTMKIAHMTPSYIEAAIKTVNNGVPDLSDYRTAGAYDRDCAKYEAALHTVIEAAKAYRFLLNKKPIFL